MTSPRLFNPVLLLLAALLAPTAAPLANDRQVSNTHEGHHVVLDETLAQLRFDFNARSDQVRQLYIVGDTCGICLRGMADLNDAFVEAMQDDPRLHTFVVHIPVLGAEERHVAAARPLLDGPRVTHYWDPVGFSGKRVQQTLEIPMYAWDVWLVYPAGVRWEDESPPEPEFWQHQLSALGLDSPNRLDAEHFADLARSLVARTGDGTGPAESPVARADGTRIAEVAQPRGMMIGEHIRGTGGYATHIQVQSIEAHGEALAGNRRWPLHRQVTRRNGLTYTEGAPWLPADLHETLHASVEINDFLVDWKDKGHQVRKDGMLKIDEVLAWKLLVSHHNGSRWALYVDSHTGDILRKDVLGEDGSVRYSIYAGDIREVNGIRVPFRRDFLAPDGRLLASEHYHAVDVRRARQGP